MKFVIIIKLVIMAQSIKEIKKFRERKLKNWRERGVNPFPEKVSCQISISEVLEKFSSLLKSKKNLSICGRITSLEIKGK